MSHDIANYLLEDVPSLQLLTEVSKRQQKKNDKNALEQTTPQKPGLVMKNKVSIVAGGEKEQPKETTKTPPRPVSKDWRENIAYEMAEDREKKNQLQSILKNIFGKNYNHQISRVQGDLVELCIILLKNLHGTTRPYKNFEDLKTDMVVNTLALKSEHEFSDEDIENVEYDTSKSDEEPVKTDIPQIKEWTSYEKFRKDMFAITVQLGWPDTMKPDPRAIKKDVEVRDAKDKDKLWSSVAKTPYPFANWGFDFLQKSSINMKTYLMTKFKNNPEGLRKLSTKVNDIVEHEKTYFKGSKGALPTFLNITGAMAMFVFKGFGGQERDLAMFNWLKSKFSKITIFQYQQSILEDITARNIITDESSTILKNMLNSMYVIVRDRCVNEIVPLKQIKTERSRYETLTAYFDVLPLGANNKTMFQIRELYFKLLYGFVGKEGRKEVLTGEPQGLLVDFTKKAVGNKKFSKGPSLDSIKKLCLEYAKTENNKENFNRVVDKGLDYVWVNKNDQGEEIGEYIWNIRATQNGVRFSLSYNHTGEE